MATEIGSSSSCFLRVDQKPDLNYIRFQWISSAIFGERAVPERAGLAASFDGYYTFHSILVTMRCDETGLRYAIRGG